MKRFHLAAVLLPICIFTYPSFQSNQRIEIRAIYGGSPVEPESEQILGDFGVNAVFVHSGHLSKDLVEKIRSDGGTIYAEFNTMHYTRFLENHPEAAPIGSDGKVSPPQEGWQGICPTHPEYRLNRMNAFQEILSRFDVSGIWLDYHHAHASWERPDPLLPDTCFCGRCISLFLQQSKIDLPEGVSTAETAGRLLSNHRKEWIQWRCDVFTDWIREFRGIIDSDKPGALLGTFHNPWSDDDLNGARINKLAIDLKAQAEFIDVFSPMPYHARFGHSEDPEWISRQVTWLGRYLGVRGAPGEKIKIWPIVQLSDWGEAVPASQVRTVMKEGVKAPATGIIIFAWGSLKEQSRKVEALKEFYLDLGSG
jgi:hypothetical protein